MKILNKLSFHKKIFLACLLTALVPLLCSSVVMIRLFTAALERQDLDEGRTQIIKAEARLEAVFEKCEEACKTIATDKKTAFEAGTSYICKLAYASAVEFAEANAAGGDGTVSVVTDNARLFMPMAELVDLDKERERIKKELANAVKQLEGQIAKLTNEKFVSRAPEAVVNAEREKKVKLDALIENLKLSLENLGK